MDQTQPRVSMRHLHLYAHLLLAEAKQNGKSVRLEWANIPTASIGPDPANPGGLVLRLSQMAAVGTEEDATLLRALISHEFVCHGHHTDFTVVPPSNLAGQLANILEDPRGELLGAKKFPGSKKVIREGIEILVDRKVFQGPQDSSDTPAAVLAGWLVTELRSELLDQDCLRQFATDFRARAIKHFGTKLTGQVKAVALQGATARDTQGAIQASIRILELLKLAADNKPDSQGGEQQSGSPQDNQDAGDPSGQTSGQQDSEDGSEPGGYEPSHNELAEAVNAVLTASPGDLGSYGKGLEEVLSEANEAIQEAQSAGGSSHTSELNEHSAPANGGSLENRSRLRSAARTTASALSLRLQDLLEAFAAATRRSCSSGKLRSNRVWRVPLGDTQVFRHKTRHDELDTCVYLLGDESGSMDEPFDSERAPHLHAAAHKPSAQDQIQAHKVDRKDAAGRVIVAAGEVLDGADIPFDLATYSESVREWKGFEGDWSSTLQRFRPEATGSTNTHLAVVWALRKFIGRSEARKVLTVVTDGDPGDRDILEAALREAAQFGVEVRFVLIGAEHVAKFHGLSATYGVANNVRELATAVFSSLEAAIC